MIHDPFHRHAPLPRRHSATLLGVIVGLLLAAVVPATASATVEPPDGGGGAPCTTVSFIGARGSGQSYTGSHGMGPAVNDLARVMKRVLRAHGLSMYLDGNPYPADSVSDLVPSRKEVALLIASPALGVYEYKKNYFDKYAASIETGTEYEIDDARARLSDCPHTKLVLAGYSQGAMAVHQAELRIAASGRRRLIRHIAGTLLIGDGDRVPNTTAHQFGTSSSGAQGIRTYLHGNSGQDVPFPATTANLCTADDLVCDFDLARLRHASQAAHIHSGYARTTTRGMHYRPSLGDAATWLAELIAA